MTPRTPEQSQRIREARREQILDAALGIFAEKGLHDTKVSEIAARAGVSQGTVYWYFDSKKELFKAVFRDRVEALFQPVFAIALDDTRSASSKLLGITRALLELAAARDEIIFVFIQTVATREVANIVAYDLADYYRQTLGLVTPLFECLGILHKLQGNAVHVPLGPFVQVFSGGRERNDNSKHSDVRLRRLRLVKFSMR